jgi:Carboxypeptidase regulatory-like domain/TonB dependent receptor
MESHRKLEFAMWSISLSFPSRSLTSSSSFTPIVSITDVPQQRLFSRHACVILTICLICCSARPCAFGQAVYGSIFGTITDRTGAVLPNAHLELTSLERGAKVETLSNPAGNYEMSHLLPGEYSLKAEAHGFKVSKVTNIPIHVDQATRVDLQLQVGGPSESIEVSAKDVPLLKTDRADVAITFDQRVILDVPLAVKGNFTALELLAPGTSILGWQHASSENPQGGIQISVNGQNWSQTSYQLDGTDNREPILGIIVINPNPEAVTEAKITTQNYDAEFGQALAGVVSTQTKSGTNRFHGSLAPSHHGGGSPIPKFLQVPGVRLASDNFWTVAGSLGGPIIKNSIFFFADYTAERLDRAAAGRFNVPTALVRKTCLDPNSGVCDLSEYPRQIWDPASGNTVLFPNNQIPRDHISPQAIALLKLMPTPNVPDAGFNQNYLSTGVDVFDDDRFDIRIDHIPSSRLQYFGRYSFADFRRYGPPAFGDLAGGIGLLDGFPGRAPARNQSLALGSNHLLTDTLLADFRFGFFRYHVNVFNSSYGTTPAKDAGIPNLNFDRTLTSGMPFMQVDGQDGDDFTMGTICNCPLYQTEQQFQWVSNWTKIHNNHSIKWGTDIRYAKNLRVPSMPVRNGAIEFNNSRTQGPGLTGGGLGLATFLLGDATSFGRMMSTTFDAGERQNRWYFYGQDTWRLNQKLTLNYGLRWEIYFPQSVSGKGQGGWLDLDTGEIRVAGYGNINRQGNVRTTLRNLAPRLGLAYAINPKTVVRLGYGRSYDLGVFGTIFGHTVTQNLPVLAQQQIGPSSPMDSVFSLKDGPPPPAPIVVPPPGRFPLPDQVRTFALPEKPRLPTVDAWNLTMQRAITPTFSVQAGYVGNKGTHVFPGDGPFYDLN